MTTKTYARPQKINNKIGYSDRSMDETDLQEFLEEGHRMLEMRVGRQYREEKIVRQRTVQGELVKEFDLKLRPVLDFHEVKLRGAIVDSSNYEVDLQKGVVTFDDAWFDEQVRRGMSIEFEYAPVAYRDLEVWYGYMALLASKKVQLDADQVETSAEQAERRATRLENYINSTVSSGTVTDGRNRHGYR